MTETEVIEKFFGNKVSTEKLNIEGFPKPLKFDIYDGYAVAVDDGCTYDMMYPQLSTIKDSKELSEAIAEYCRCEKSQITILHVLITFNTLFKNGVEIIC